MNRLPCSLTESGLQEETKQESKNLQVSSGWTLIAYINAKARPAPAVDRKTCLHCALQSPSGAN